MIFWLHFSVCILVPIYPFLFTIFIVDDNVNDDYKFTGAAICCMVFIENVLLLPFFFQRWYSTRLPFTFYYNFASFPIFITNPLRHSRTPFKFSSVSFSLVSVVCPNHQPNGLFQLSIAVTTVTTSDSTLSASGPVNIPLAREFSSTHTLFHL